MRSTSPIRFALAALALALPLQAAHAESDEPVPFDLECTFTCDAGGFEINVYQHETLSQYVLQLMPTNEVYYTDFASATSGATFIGSQNVAGSDYSDLYCEQSGEYINGNVYENTSSSSWNSHTTPPLNGLLNPCGQADINQIAAYTESPQLDVPEFCTDVGCAGPPSGVISFTDPDDDYPDSVEVTFTYCWDEGAGELYPCEGTSADDGSSGGGVPEGDLCWDQFMGYQPCEYAFEDADTQAEAVDPVDPSDFNTATLHVETAPPVGGSCTVDATFTVQADWSPTADEVDLVDIYWANGFVPDAYGATDADVDFVDVQGGLYSTTFEGSRVQPRGDGRTPDTFSGFASMDYLYVNCECAELVGDFDGDGAEHLDLIELLSAIGTFSAEHDLDGDEVVASDLIASSAPARSATADCCTG